MSVEPGILGRIAEVLRRNGTEGMFDEALFPSLTYGKPVNHCPGALDKLNASVTDALVLAAGLTIYSDEWKAAMRSVAAFEEQIASCADASELERELGMVGAVTAMVGSGETEKAIELADRYLAVVTSPLVERELRNLREAAAHP